MDGSSPRAWGIRPQGPSSRSRCRFIPTCVGNTTGPQAAAPDPPVHPHVRGEYIAARAAQLGQHGSSPRAWGIHISLSHRMDSVRFIPTCVGNTHPPARARIAVSVHPHVRGEYTLAQHGRIGQDGSSPRAWGIPTASCYGTSPPRFIPTCVGNTGKLPTGPPDHKVHPHVRGEYAQAAQDQQADARFIPTCVGNTRFRCHCIYSGYGSSPRAWGIPGAGEQPRVAARFIPTCVGNTRGPGNPGSHTFGSSPRAWGIPPDGHNGIGMGRFIPTCVGNTL